MRLCLQVILQLAWLLGGDVCILLRSKINELRTYILGPSTLENYLFQSYFTIQNLKTGQILSKTSQGLHQVWGSEARALWLVSSTAAVLGCELHYQIAPSVLPSRARVC